MGRLCREYVVVVGLDVGMSCFCFFCFVFDPCYWPMRVSKLYKFVSKYSMYRRFEPCGSLSSCRSGLFCRGSTLPHARILYNDLSRNILKGWFMVLQGFHTPRHGGATHLRPMGRSGNQRGIRCIPVLQMEYDDIGVNSIKSRIHYVPRIRNCIRVSFPC